MAMKSGFSDVFRCQDFLWLWYGQIISSIGDRFYLFALVAVILGIDQGASQDSNVGKEMARFSFCAMVPGLLLAPLYGWLVDQCNRRWVMIWADLGRVVLTLSILYVWFILHSLVGVYLVVFGMGALNGLFIPARQAALPQIISLEALVSANALISLIGVIANFIGVLFASLIVSIFGAWSSFLLNALGLCASAFFIYRIKANLAPQQGRHPRQGFWRESLRGIHVLQEQSSLRPLIIVTAIVSFISTLVMITILQQTVETMNLHAVQMLADFLTKFITPFSPKPPVFKIGPLAFGLLFACIGIGLGLGVGFCGWAQRWSRSQGLPFLALALLGISLISFAQIHRFIPALFGAILLGLVSSLIVIPIESRLQNDVDDERRGRLFAFKNLCTTLGLLLGLAVNIDGRLLSTVGPTAILNVAGEGTILVALILAFWNHRSLTTFWKVRTPPQST